MGFYGDHIEPRMVDFACGLKPILKERSKIVHAAEGRVLEIGFGSGRNAPYYDRSKITHLFALEPSGPMRRLAGKRVADFPFAFEWLDLPGEEIPLDAESVDTVLVTFSLCTIPGVADALAGMRRVLKPGGRMVFLEHGAAPDAGVRRWQDRLNGVWGKLAGGCHLNRDAPALIREAGFQIDRMDQHYMRKSPKFAGFVSAGVASR